MTEAEIRSELQAVFRQVFGDDEITLRLPSTVDGPMASPELVLPPAGAGVAGAGAGAAGAGVTGAGVAGGGAGVAVGPAEAQAVLHRVQLRQPPALLHRGDLALHPGLERAARGTAGMGPAQRPVGPVPRLIKEAIKHIEIRLLLADSRLAGGIGLTERHISWYTFALLKWHAGRNSWSSGTGTK